MITYDSGKDGLYTSKANRKKAGLPILLQSTKLVDVANVSTSCRKFVTQLPSSQLTKQVEEAVTFQEFPTLLMSVGNKCGLGKTMQNPDNLEKATS